MMHVHWTYFLTIEQDIIDISRYIEIHKNNFSTFSVELTRLVLTICSEVDVVAKLLCNKINQEEWASVIDDLKHEDKKPTMQTYMSFLYRTLPSVSEIEITIPVHGYTCIPWENFSRKMLPEWWGKYNHLKHRRDEHYEYGNLKIVLKSASGLLVLLMFYYGLGARGSPLTLGGQYRLKLFSFPREFASGGIEWENSTLFIPDRHKPPSQP